MIAHSIQIDGSNVRDLDFDQPVVNIGSHPESDVAIAGEGILPFHAMVILRDGAFQLTRLSPEALVSVDGSPIHEETITLAEKQCVTIGGYTISFGRNHSPTGMHVSVSMPGTGVTPAAGPPANLDKTILVNVISQHTEIQVTQSAVYELEVVNAGHIVAGFSVSLQGVPAEWVEINPQTFNLNEHQRTAVTITVTPPRDPSSTAGRHSLKAVVSSPNYPGSQVTMPLDLLIEPYYEFSLGNLTPKQQNIPWRKQFGRVRLPVTNRGNGPADFTVLAYDDENGCSFDFQVRDDLQLNRQATFNVQAGSTLGLPIDITPLKRHVFAMRNKRYQYTTTVHVAQEAVSQQVVSGSVTSHPLFGWWTIVLSVMAILLGLFVLVQPRIQSFSVAAGKDVIELGDTTKLEWKVSPFATRVNISNVDQAIKYGQTSLTVAPKQSTTYELVAGNWLSGLLGLDQKKIQTVLVVPPSPTVNVFEVDNTSVARGKPVNVRWSVTQADKAVLTIGGVVYELSPEKFSGEQSVVLDKDSLVTLAARNASGNELRSYFINVTDPFIKVNSFVVWVRPKAAVSTTPGQPLLAAVRPDLFMGFSMPRLAAPALADDFIEKYVELVEDPSSDQGYRVEFHQPGRELSKGEQVMVEWDVLGTDDDTVKIAPFTETLPSKGRQPYFPQASMNFVLTAQSGEQKKLFMLPVVVFDGTPPVAPKIDIFRASPMSITGPGKVQFTWSVSGEWTRIELSSGAGVVGKNLNPEGFKTVSVSKSDTFVLKAWNGTLSSSQALDITINPALKDPGLKITSISPNTGVLKVGGRITVTVGFTPPPGESAPTGTVSVTDGSAICTIPLPSTSCDIVFITPSKMDADGNLIPKTIAASYPGDKIYFQDDDKSTAVASIPQEFVFFDLVVEPSRVSLSAAYKSAKDAAVDITKLKMNDGLHVTVIVHALNTTLVDNNGVVNASLCNPDGVTNCKPVGSIDAIVTPTPATPSMDGVANIYIQKLNMGDPSLLTSGLHALVLKYAHRTNSITPTSITQALTIARAKLVLSLSSCDNPDVLDNCRYGLGGQDEVLFDLKTPGSSGALEMLSSQMPMPKATAFRISTSFNAATTPITINNPWTCSIKDIDGTWKLSCTGTGLVSGAAPYQVAYIHDNSMSGDYYMCDGCTDSQAVYSPRPPFRLTVKMATIVEIADFYNIKVGERIELTAPGGTNARVQISYTDSTGTHPITESGALTLTATGTTADGLDFDFLGVQGGNCTVQDKGKRIDVSATGVICYIYFKHAGTYKLVATFLGSANYGSSVSLEKTVTVGKQGNIIYRPVTPNMGELEQHISVTAGLEGPPSQAFSTDETSFPPSALVGRTLVLTPLDQWSADNCTIDGKTKASTYDITIGSTSSGIAANFIVSCTSQAAHIFSFSMKFLDEKDFDFVSSPLVGNISMARKSDAGVLTLSVLRLADDPDKEMVLPDGNLDMLHFGEKYNANITLVNTDRYFWRQVRVATSYWPDYSPEEITWQTLDDSNALFNAIANNYSSAQKDWSIGIGIDKWCQSQTFTSDSQKTENASDVVPIDLGCTDGGFFWTERTCKTGYLHPVTVTTTLTSTCEINEDLPLGTPSSALPLNQNAVVVAEANLTIGGNPRSSSSQKTFAGFNKQTLGITFTPPNPAITTVSKALPVTLTFTREIPQSTLSPFAGVGPFFGINSPCNTNLSVAETGLPTTLNFTVSSSGVYSGCQISYAGNNYFKELNNQTLPTLTFVDSTTITNVSAPTGAYNAGKTIPITVTFSRPVDVTGTPHLHLNSATGRTATYASGTGSNTLTFNYTVLAGDNSNPLNYDPTIDSLHVDGATIRDTTYHLDANLKLPTGSDSLGVSNVVVDTTAPHTTIFGAGPTFTFSSPDGGISFECWVDLSAPASCTGSYTASVSPGQHTFYVRATDQAGNIESPPAFRTWTQP